MTRLSIRSLVLALTLAILFASCGSESDGASPDAANSSSEITAASVPATTTVEPTMSTSVSDDLVDRSPPESSAVTQSSTSSTEVDELPLPTDPVKLASALTEAERAVRERSMPDDQLRRWGRRQQQLYRSLDANPDWKDAVLASLEADIVPFVELNSTARENLTTLVGSEDLSETMPAWEVVEPLPAAELVRLYKEAEAVTGVAWEFLAAINLVETRMGRIRGISTAGAVGPMQFLPTTWAECCQGDPTVPADAITGAGQYLVDRGGPGNMAKAIRGYNNSANYVNAVTAYAEVMMIDERAYWGYHGWGIYFRSTAGLIEIPVGYYEPEPVDANAWLAENPEALFSN